MPSKGVQAYTYISAPGGVEIDISVPKQEETRSAQRKWETGNFEVDAGKIKWPLKRTGRFTFKVRRKDPQAVITEQWMDVDPISGDIASASTFEDTMLETRSIIDKGLAVSYGVYEAGPGQAGLPNRHQAYMVVTQEWNNWQGIVAPAGSEQEKKKFACFVLPSPHDVGMNSMDTMNAILKHAGVASAKVLTSVMPALQRGQDSIAKVIGGLADVTVSKIAPDIIASFSGQRIATRPSSRTPLPDKLYFQHGPIPGMAYDQFLNDLVAFLVKNPSEIAVVHVRWDGVPAECARPDDAELQNYLNAALTLSNGAVKSGNMNDLRNATIQELRSQKKRLLYVVNEGVLSTYDDIANATVDGRSMISAFERVLTSQNQEGKNMTVAQCQATPTNIKDVIYYSVVSASVSTMALMATKALCGHLLLPWLRDNVMSRCKKDQLLVIMDDFIDGSDTDVAVELSKKRLA
ncbi:unnamed protein product [Parascedosporium putredinis]|uniref:PLC-like phosphodiesterase n=1 Tax=Parascedosporium putredinis TaxID=1442378 RepID=A0A9P1H550_9PEZI|nr:unnamed protein product [Parascedosporium putredinis]CAI7996204.1 unnamed protein product [Parascedosporium putredinis]